LCAKVASLLGARPVDLHMPDSTPGAMRLIWLALLPADTKHFIACADEAGNQVSSYMASAADDYCAHWVRSFC
jgi:hypothetical protein